MFDYNKYIFLITIILTIVFLPLVNAELQPAFLDQNIHYLGEEINYGLKGIVPDNIKNVEIIIETLDLNEIYLDNNFNIFSTNELYFLTTENSNKSIQFKYIYYDDYNLEISNKIYNLELWDTPFISDFAFCNTIDCSSSKYNDFYISDNTYSITDGEPIYLNSLNTLEELGTYNIVITNEFGYTEQTINDINLPQKINLSAGNYLFSISQDYNLQKFTKKIKLYILEISNDEINTWEDYFINEKVQDYNTQKNIENITDIDLTYNPEKSSTNDSTKYIIIGLVLTIIVIFILIMIFKKKKNEKGPDEKNRRTTRMLRTSLFFIFVLLLLNPISASISKFQEYEHLEINYVNLQQLFPYPEMVPIYISPSNPEYTAFVPIISDSLTEYLRVSPKLDSPDNSFNLSLLPVLFATNINTAKTQNLELPMTGCEVILYWYDKNPIVDTESLINRQPEMLKKNIIIKNTDDPKKKSRTSDCINDLINKKYLFEKKILLQINYKDTNTQRIEDVIIKNKLYFARDDDQDVSSEFLNDLKNIFIVIDYRDNVLNNSDIKIKGIDSTKIKIVNYSKSADNEKITLPDIKNQVTGYLITQIDPNKPITIDYNAYLLDLDYDDQILNNTKKFGDDNFTYISKKNYLTIKKQTIARINISATITCSTENNCELIFSDSTNKLLTTISNNPLKYLLIKKNILLQIGSENPFTLGIDSNYGILYSIGENIKQPVNSEKTLEYNLGVADTTPEINLLSKLLEKETAAKKSIILENHILKLLYIYSVEFSNNTDAVYQNLNSENKYTVLTGNLSKIQQIIKKTNSSNIEIDFKKAYFLADNIDICFELAAKDKSSTDVCLTNQDKQDKIYAAARSNTVVGDFYKYKYINTILVGDRETYKQELEKELINLNPDSEKLTYYKDTLSLPFNTILLQANYLDGYAKHGIYTSTQSDNRWIDTPQESITKEQLTENAYVALLIINDIYELTPDKKLNYNPESFSAKKLVLVDSLAGMYIASNKNTEALAITQKLYSNYIKTETHTSPEIIDLLLKTNKLAGTNSFRKINQDILINQYDTQNLEAELLQTGSKNLIAQFKNSDDIFKNTAILFINGGYLKDIYGVMGGFDKLKQQFANLNEQNKNLLTGVNCISTLYYTKNGSEIKKWITNNSVIYNNYQGCKPQAALLFYDKQYGLDTQKILGTENINYDFINYRLNQKDKLGIDSDIQRTQFSTYLKQIEATNKTTAKEVFDYIDSGINPLTVIIIFATVGFAAPANLSSGISGSAITGNFTKQVAIELGKNVLIDSAVGAVITKAKVDQTTTLSLILTFAACGVSGSVKNLSTKSLDNVLDDVAVDVERSITTNEQSIDDLTKLNIKSTISDSFKNAENPSNLIHNIVNNLKTKNILVSETDVSKILIKNKLYVPSINNPDVGSFSGVLKKAQTQKMLELQRTYKTSVVNNTYVKTHGTAPFRFGISFDNISDEYYSLMKLNQIDPDHVVKPIRPIFDNSQNKIVGYEMEKINGVTLSEYLQDHHVTPEFIANIKKSINKMHDSGYAHGDISAKNIMVIETSKGLDFKFIDPVGYPNLNSFSVNGKSLKAEAIALDNQQVIRLENYINNNTPLSTTNATLQNIYAGQEVAIYRTSGKIQSANIIDIDYSNNKAIVGFSENGDYFNKSVYLDEIYTSQKVGDKVLISRSGGIQEATILEIDKDLAKIKVKFFEDDVWKSKNIGYTDTVNPSTLPNIPKSGEYNLGDKIKIRRSSGLIQDAVVEEKDGKLIAAFYEDGTRKYHPLDKAEIITTNDYATPIRATPILNAADNSFKNYLRTMDVDKLSEINTSPYIVSYEPLPDVFVYTKTGGWEVTPDSRELIYVNKLKDPQLQDYLTNVKKIASNKKSNEKDIVKEIMKYQNTEIIYDTKGVPQISGSPQYLNGVNIGNEIVPLGYFITTHQGVCRHRATLLKLAYDEAGIDSKLVRGTVTQNEEYIGRHIWLEVKLSNGEILIVDPMWNSISKNLDVDMGGGVIRNRIPDGSLEFYVPKGTSKIADATAQASEIIEKDKKILGRINLDIYENYNPNNLSDIQKLDDAAAALRHIYKEEGQFNFNELNLSSNDDLVDQLNNRILENVRNQINELNYYYENLRRMNVPTLSRYEQSSLLEKSIFEYKKILIMSKYSNVPLDNSNINELARLRMWHNEIFQNVR